MCEPTTLFIASTAFSALTTFAQYQGAQDQAKAQTAFQQQQAEENERFAEQNRLAALRSFEDQTSQEQLRLKQTRESASVELQDIQRSKLEAQGQALASSDFAGTNIDLLLGDFERQEANFRSTVGRQLEFETLQFSENLRGLNAQAEDRINSVRPFVAQPVSYPSLTGAVAGFGAQTVGNFNTFKPTFGKGK